MGKQIATSNAPFVGRVGSTVGYYWKHIPCIRTYRKTVNYPNTAGQQRERDWFVAMVRFAARARAALVLGLGHKADDARMTEGNYFVTTNKQHFQHSGDELLVDYARLQLAEGAAAPVLFHDAVFRDNQTVSIDFDKNTLFSRASADDKVYVYAYSHDMADGVLSAPVERRNRNITIRLPEGWSGTTVHLYGFVIDRDGRPSNSTYIGAGRLDHYSEGGIYIPLNKSWMDFVAVANRVNATGTAAPAGKPTPSPAPAASPTAPAPPGTPQPSD